ncbi:MAG: hypothetical protein WDO24_12350 [Pseudomonadota bacterium]
MGEPFKSFDRFEQADLARRLTPDLSRQRTERWRKKASDLRAKAGHCNQDGVRDSFLDIADTYDRLADAAE